MNLVIQEQKSQNKYQQTRYRSKVSLIKDGKWGMKEKKVVSGGGEVKLKIEVVITPNVL